MSYHCEYCQKGAGGPCQTNAVFKAIDLHIRDDTAKLTKYCFSSQEGGKWFPEGKVVLQRKFNKSACWVKSFRLLAIRLNYLSASSHSLYKANQMRQLCGCTMFIKPMKHKGEVIVVQTGILDLKGNDRLAPSKEFFTCECQTYMPTLKIHVNSRECRRRLSRRIENLLPEAEFQGT
jgi:hypothetical protein